MYIHKKSPEEPKRLINNAEIGLEKSTSSSLQAEQAEPYHFCSGGEDQRRRRSAEAELAEALLRQRSTAATVLLL
jgi:hypothetical protein